MKGTQNCISEHNCAFFAILFTLVSCFTKITTGYPKYHVLKIEMGFDYLEEKFELKQDIKTGFPLSICLSLNIRIYPANRIPCL